MIIRFMLAKFYFCYSKYWKFKIFDRHSSYYFDNNAHLSSILLLLNLSPPTANGVPQHPRVDRSTAFPKRLLCCLHLKLGRSSFFPTTYRHLLTLSHNTSPRNLCYVWDYPPHFICNSVQLKKLMFFLFVTETAYSDAESIQDLLALCNKHPSLCSNYSDNFYTKFLHAFRQSGVKKTSALLMTDILQMCISKGNKQYILVTCCRF